MDANLFIVETEDFTVTVQPKSDNIVNIQNFINKLNNLILSADSAANSAF